MRIHRLEMQAFGPFAERQVVDFDELGAQGLFLLNGPTGAGKTSVLDAICFALYGTVPGARQAARKLRSDHAAPGTAPEVVLDFSAGPRRFEVVRSPQWERPAKRAGTATGTVTEQARTLLREQVGGEWVQKTTRNDEAALEIRDVLGMNCEQFTRVVMLPQGEFAAFLRADATSRAELLQRLFGTERFEEIERQLKEQSAAAHTELAGAQAAVDLVAAQVRSEAERCRRLMGDAEDLPGDTGETGSGVPADAGPPEDSAWLTAFQGSVTARLETLRAAQQLRTGTLAQAETVLHRLQSRRARGLALLQLEADERDHATRQEASLPVRHALAAHTRAEGLAGYLAAADAAGRSLAQARSAAGTALDGLEEAAGAAGLADELPARSGAGAADHPAAAGLDGLEAATGAELTAAEAALAEARQLDGLVRGAADDRAVERDARTAAEGHREAAAVLRREQSVLRENLPGLRNAAAGAEAARSRLEQAEELLTVIEQYAAARSGAADSAEAAAAAREDYQDRRGHWQDLLQLRLDQAAAELAAALTDGEACPVCGSSEHPSPAPLPDSGKLVAREEETAARTRSEAAEKAWEDARTAAAADAAAADALKARGGGTDPAEALQAREDATAAVRQTEDATVQLAAAERRLLDLEAEIAGHDTKSAQLERDAALADARAAAAEAECEQLRSRSADLRKGSATLQQRVEALRLVRARCSAARTALLAVAHARESADTSRQALEEALTGTGFADAEAARAALLPVAEAAELRRGIESLDADAARLALRREGEDAAAARDEGGEPVSMPDEEDVAEAAEAAEAAARELSDGAVQVRLLESSASTFAELAVRLGEAEERVLPLKQRFELLQAVTDTARGNGENNYRMALSTYVLAARLEQVAAAATERLAAMTAGRYALVHDDSRSGNRKAGLGLHVIDDWTGVRRDTSTLSGGESFMASLALALGLADVVQHESGGTAMETLFVDEGFGSLDDEALEQVMDALEGLRDGGRVVGLVSHVAEMKQRIGAQLQITRGRNGSSIRFRTALPA